MRQVILKALNIIAEPFIFLTLVLCAMVARFVPKEVDIGLGPLPLINNIYHKKVFERCGYTAETFVFQVWHITTDFDVRADTHPIAKIPVIGHNLNFLRFAIRALFRYRCILIYFDGGVIGVPQTCWLWRVEPFIMRLANVKTIVLAYGSDVQDMARSPNLLFKDAISKDYPGHRKARKKIEVKIDLWSSYGDHVVGGCEWVYYMHHWDTLMISHFSIDESRWKDQAAISTHSQSAGTMRILHAPNHRTIKGTAHIIAAVEALQEEGLDIELVLVEKRPNHEVKELMKSCTVVVDQLIVGWYAMFAIEAMAMGKPVICYYRKDLEELFRVAGLMGPEEDIPLISSSPLEIKQTLKELYQNREKLKKRGSAGRPFVLRHHSIDAIAKTFGPIAGSLLGAPLSGRQRPPS